MKKILITGAAGFYRVSLMHNWANRDGMSHISVSGAVGKITEALAS